MRVISAYRGPLLCVGMLLAMACSDGQNAVAPSPVAPVATVTVSLPTATLATGGRATATAVLEDAAGDTLTNRSTTWTSSPSSVASVDGSGVVTGVAPGTATITAKSEGRSGSAAIAVTPPPLEPIVITGSSWMKVGDSYTFSAVDHLGDGTIAYRPATWTISDPTMGVMTSYGQLTPSQPGAFTLQASVDGLTWEGSTTAYDWQSWNDHGDVYAAVYSDFWVTNEDGASELPSLAVACSREGYFFVWVQFATLVTGSGDVTYEPDAGPITSQRWDELGPSYNSLWYPGNNSQTKAFANAVAGARSLGFGFTERNGSARTTLFRVTGLGRRLAPMLGACPSNSLDLSSAGAKTALTRLESAAAAVIGHTMTGRRNPHLAS